MRPAKRRQTGPRELELDETISAEKVLAVTCVKRCFTNNAILANFTVVTVQVRALNT